MFIVHYFFHALLILVMIDPNKFRRVLYPVVLGLIKNEKIELWVEIL